jgi:hypothetical protein
VTEAMRKVTSARWITVVAQTATAADDWGRRRRKTGGDGGGRLGAPAAGMVVDDPGGGDEVGGGGDEVGGGEGFGAARDLERRCVCVGNNWKTFRPRAWRDEAARKEKTPFLLARIGELFGALRTQWNDLILWVDWARQRFSFFCRSA